MQGQIIECIGREVAERPFFAIDPHRGEISVHARLPDIRLFVTPRISDMFSIGAVFEHKSPNSTAFAVQYEPSLSIGPRRPLDSVSCDEANEKAVWAKYEGMGFRSWTHGHDHLHGKGISGGSSGVNVKSMDGAFGVYSGTVNGRALEGERVVRQGFYVGRGQEPGSLKTLDEFCMEMINKLRVAGKGSTLSQDLHQGGTVWDTVELASWAYAILMKHAREAQVYLPQQQFSAAGPLLLSEIPPDPTSLRGAAEEVMKAVIDTFVNLLKKEGKEREAMQAAIKALAGYLNGSSDKQGEMDELVSLLASLKGQREKYEELQDKSEKTELLKSLRQMEQRAKQLKVQRAQKLKVLELRDRERMEVALLTVELLERFQEESSGQSKQQQQQQQQCLSAYLKRADQVSGAGDKVLGGLMIAVGVLLIPLFGLGAVPIYYGWKRTQPTGLAAAMDKVGVRVKERLKEESGSRHGLSCL